MHQILSLKDSGMKTYSFIDDISLLNLFIAYLLLILIQK